jgi:hypothetical protein
MSQIPTARGLLLCDQAIVEDGTRRLTLVNCFTRKQVRRDPPEAVSFAIVAFLNGGQGEIKLELVFERLDTGAELYRWETRGHFPDPLREFRLLVRMNGFVFPTLGTYDVVLFADREPIAQCLLTVFRQRRTT